MNKRHLTGTDISMAMELLRGALERNSKAWVAEKLGISRTAVSLLMNDKYPSRPDKIAARAIEVFGRVMCPYLGLEIDLAQCSETHGGKASTWDPAALDHRRACQKCPSRKDAQ